LRKFNVIRFDNVRFFKKPSLYALKTLNFKLTLSSLVTASTAHEQLLSPVGKKVPFPPFDEFCFLRKSFGHLRFHDNFLENLQILSVFTKYFAKRIQDLQYSKFFSNCPTHWKCFTYILVNLSGKQIFSKFSLKKQIFSRKSENQYVFTKMVPFFHKLLTRFSPFF